MNGSRTYDRIGFGLDKGYIIKYIGGRLRLLGHKVLDRLEEKRKDSKKKAEIIGVSGDDGKICEEAWDDRVARDWGIVYHEVRMEEYEERQKKGFKAKKRKISKKAPERLMDLMSGSALGKGSKHR